MPYLPDNVRYLSHSLSIHGTSQETGAL